MVPAFQRMVHFCQNCLGPVLRQEFCTWTLDLTYRDLRRERSKCLTITEVFSQVGQLWNFFIGGPQSSFVASNESRGACQGAVTKAPLLCGSYVDLGGPHHWHHSHQELWFKD